MDHIGGLISISWQSRLWTLRVRTPETPCVAFDAGFMMNPFQIQCRLVTWRHDGVWLQSEDGMESDCSLFSATSASMEDESLEMRFVFEKHGLKPFSGFIDDDEQFQSWWNLLAEIQDGAEMDYNPAETTVFRSPLEMAASIEKRRRLILKTPEAISRMLIFSGRKPLNFDSLHMDHVESIEVNVEWTMKGFCFC